MMTQAITRVIPPQITGNSTIAVLREQYIEDYSITQYAIPKIDEEHDILVAMIYDESTNETNAVIQKSYQTFIEHLLKQYRVLKKHGYKFYPSMKHYPDSVTMITELAVKKAIRYLPSYATDSIDNEHIMMQRTNAVDSQGNRLVATEVFRCVHDALAHAAGYSFGVIGEKGAWLIHRSCLPRDAHLALWNEARAQNTWTNAGPHMRKPDGKGFYTILKPGDPGFIPLPERPFPYQKTVVAPDEFT